MSRVFAHCGWKREGFFDTTGPMSKEARRSRSFWKTRGRRRTGIHGTNWQLIQTTTQFSRLLLVFVVIDVSIVSSGSATSLAGTGRTLRTKPSIVNLLASRLDLISANDGPAHRSLDEVGQTAGEMRRRTRVPALLTGSCSIDVVQRPSSLDMDFGRHWGVKAAPQDYPTFSVKISCNPQSPHPPHHHLSSIRTPPAILQLLNDLTNATLGRGTATIGFVVCDARLAKRV